MNVGILTFYKDDNYGSVLQAVALKTYLKSIGCESKIIDITSQRSLFLSRETHLVSAQRIKRGVNRLLLAVNFQGYQDGMQKKAEIFEKFREENLDIIPYSEDLNENFDGFIAGSDQIWNCTHGLKKVYFLDFADDSSFKISYAASFGSVNMPDEYRDEVKELLNRFDGISVREKQGQAILKQRFDVDAPVVCDPCFLLSKAEWKELLGIQEKKEEYILCYFLGEQKIYWKIVDEYAKRYDVPVKVIPGTSFVRYCNCEVLYECGPREFVEHIVSARFFFTDSFHGMVFSLIMNTPMIPFKRFAENDENSQNSRVVDLMERFGCTDGFAERNISCVKPVIVSQEATERILDSFVSASKEFLMQVNEKVKTGKIYE